ncbi:Transcriptional factor B3 family protein [Rhynchospora pubera]|uniref:Transcriptional factor B3 family protein n=1 Tax=Rhynchospora pubera TaxID=906938 RepID=A0AAV8BYJ1_9POAL|nr:Transcriptional factor B3 family protein [Rhynchospora pubera]
MKHMENEDKNCSVASVFSPLRKFWFIKLIKDDSRIFFKDGWPEFSKFHKLEVGFTLVFRYEGNMILNVKVFGLDGCLKDYKQGTVALLRRTGFNVSREKCAEKRTKVTEGPSCSDKQKKRKHDLLMGATPHDQRSNVQHELRTTSNSNVRKKYVISTSYETHETIMSHYNIHKFMPLPKKFGSVSPYILETGEVTVKNEKQETWKVQFNTPSRYNNLCRGWKEFCWQNRIK